MTTKTSEMVVVETMPQCWRSSHVAAGNGGIWPHNGAQRLVMDREDAEDMVSADPDWTEILEDEDPADYADQ